MFAIRVRLYVLEMLTIIFCPEARHKNCKWKFPRLGTRRRRPRVVVGIGTSRAARAGLDEHVVDSSMHYVVVFVVVTNSRSELRSENKRCFVQC